MRTVENAMAVRPFLDCRLIGGAMARKMTITSAAERQAAVERAADVFGCSNDSEEARERAALSQAVQRYDAAVAALQRVGQNDNVRAKR